MMGGDIWKDFDKPRARNYASTRLGILGGMEVFADREPDTDCLLSDAAAGHCFRDTYQK